MADQITKSVRRIVKGMKDDPTGLGIADDYKGIGTSRGEAFINSRGDVTGSGADGSGEDKDEQPPSSTPETGNPEDNDTGGTGGINDGSDPTDALSGDVDAVVPLIDTDTQVGTVTGTDPATGNVSSFNPNTLEGIEYVPPIGWADPDINPDNDDFVPDEYWQTQVNVASRNQTSAGSCKAYAADNGYTFTRVDSTASDDVKNCIVDTGGGDVSFGMNRLPCGTPPGTELLPFCLIDPVTGDWPTDGSCQVVYDVSAGGYKGNARDPDCSAAQKTASDSIIIRSVDDANKYYKFTKMADGGTKITEVDSGGVIITDSVIKTLDEGGRFSNVYPDTLDASII